MPRKLVTLQDDFANTVTMDDGTEIRVNLFSHNETAALLEALTGQKPPRSLSGYTPPPPDEHVIRHAPEKPRVAPRQAVTAPADTPPVPPALSRPALGTNSRGALLPDVASGGRRRW